MKLIKRRVQCPLFFPIFLKAGDTISHIFRKLEKDKMVWFGSKLNINFNSSRVEYIKDWLWDIIQNKDKYIIKDVMDILYNPWWARNK